MVSQPPPTEVGLLFESGRPATGRRSWRRRSHRSMTLWPDGSRSEWRPSCWPRTSRLPLLAQLVATAPFYLTPRPAESDPATFSSDLTHLVLCWLRSSGWIGHIMPDRRRQPDRRTRQDRGPGAPRHDLVAGVAGEHAAVDAAGVLPGHPGGLRHSACCGGFPSPAQTRP